MAQRIARRVWVNRSRTAGPIPARRRSGQAKSVTRSLRLEESVDVELQTQEAGNPRRRNLKERKRGVRNAARSPRPCGRTGPTSGRRGHRSQLRIVAIVPSGDAHDRVERIGPAIEVAVDVERKVVAEDARRVRPGCAGRAVWPDANRDDGAFATDWRRRARLRTASGRSVPVDRSGPASVSDRPPTFRACRQCRRRARSRR